ncbi:hypothetical protein Peur_000019 [Populus x canadensis]
MFKNLADPAKTLDSLLFYTACYERETGRAVLRSCSEGGPLFSSVSHVLAAREQSSSVPHLQLFICEHEWGILLVHVKVKQCIGQYIL